MNRNRLIILVSCLLLSQSCWAICSKLDFEGVSWPQSIPEKHHIPFELSLNITGSFEGHHGWSNLANNFDGMGISLGLLNQNLGQGTLQPLFVDLRNGNLNTMKGTFGASNLATMLDMLDAWEKTAPTAFDRRAPYLAQYGFSKLDDPEMIARELEISVDELESELNVMAGDRNTASVEWAKKNVLNGKAIKDDWKIELKAAAESAPYRSIQIEEAQGLYQRALNLLSKYRLKELRSYLFFFDIIVQNGGLPEAILGKYNAYIKANPKASETLRLKQILTLRLAYVRKKYRLDVYRRKLSIINGYGIVHGAKRDYEREYCSDINVPMPG